MRKLIQFALLAGLLSVPSVIAQTLPGDPYEGQQLARQVCSICHSVEKGGDAVSPKGAPAFQDVADNPAINPISLRVFLQTPHETMPNLILTEAETDDVIAYILSMR